MGSPMPGLPFPPKPYSSSQIGDCVMFMHSIRLTVDPITIREPKTIASYNVMGTVDNPAVSIPGDPPQWTPPTTPPKLSEDNSQYYRDINAAYSPFHPMLATAKAVLTTRTSTNLDLVACASTLRNLFEFIKGAPKTFRIAVEAVGKTVSFVRREASPRSLIPNVRGYGHTMPEAYTTLPASFAGSISNQRVIGYRLGALSCALSEMIPATTSVASATASGSSAQNSSRDDDGDDRQLEDILSSANLPKDVRTGGDDVGSDLTVKRAGISIPQRATFELKTRSFRRREEDFFIEFAARLWLTQTPNFMVADRVGGWEGENQDVLRRFGGLLQWIVERARAEEDGMMELWRHEAGDLAVRKVGGNIVGALPGEVEDEWIERQDDEEDEEQEN
ncbi:MAG: hypothetical protein M1822_002556 [Bathelium mastoideum]|nr:MAG: hypothetical protein M1822_002556 [Bathelium mastoideum]